MVAVLLFQASLKRIRIFFKPLYYTNRPSVHTRKPKEVGHGPKCILVGLINQSHRRIYSLLILPEGFNPRKKSRVNLRLFQDVQQFFCNAEVAMKVKSLGLPSIAFESSMDRPTKTHASENTPPFL